jgi:hypothetical protein
VLSAQGLMPGVPSGDQPLTLSGELSTIVV